MVGGVAVALIAMLPQASADSLKLISGTYSNGGSGGAYTAIFSGAGLSGPIDSSSYSALVSSSTSFETFCLEPTEYFSSGNIYNYTVAKFAFGGGVDNHESNPAAQGDLLSKGTSWLYTQYASGSLMGSLANAYSSDVTIRKTANLKLQRAFWFLEDDFSLTDPLNNPYLALVATQFGSLALAQANAGASEYDVYALNLTSGSGSTLKQHQSQLYYHVPPRVPDGGVTVGMIGLGLALVALQRRRLARRF